MSDSDGSVIVNVGMNIDDAEKELDRLGKRVIKLQNDLNETSGKKSSLEKEFQRANEELKQLYATAARDKNGLLLPDEAAKLEQLEQRAAWLGEQLDKTSKQEIIDRAALDGANNAFGELSKQVVELQSVEQQPDPEAQHLAEIAANAEIADQHIVDLTQELTELKARQAELQSAGVGLGFEEFDANQQRIAEINSELQEYSYNLKNADYSEEQAAAGAERTGSAMQRAAGFAEKFGNRIAGLAKRVFVFSLVTAGLRALRSWLASVIQTNAQAQASLSQLKAAFLTLAQPILQVLIPALVFLLNILTRVVTMIANVVSKLFGTTLASSAKAAQSLYTANTGVGGSAGKASKSLGKEADAMKDVKEEAKEATKSLAAFDEINTLETDKPDEDIDDMTDDLSDLGDAGGGGIGGGGMPDFASLIKSQIDAILELFVGIALLALGAILTFSGANIPLGIGLMILGALLIADAVTTNWEAIKEALNGQLGDLVILIGGFLLVIGVILVTAGVIPLGLGMIVAGAGLLATAIAARWGSIQQILSDEFNAIATILVGIALLVIGLILSFTGVALPIGIALIAAGAIALGMTAVANWGSMAELLNNEIVQIVLLLVGAALVVIGLILCFTGAGIPLGLGFILAGATALAVAACAANWETIETILQDKFVMIGMLAATIGLIVIGLVLCFTGVGIPLGLGMILAGAVGLAATVAANWDFILEKLKGAWERIKTWWNTNVKNFVDPNWWIELGKSMVNGLMQGLNTIFEKINGWISGIKSKISEGLAAAKAAFSGGDADASGVGRSIAYDALPSIPITEVPALARGAVIPANREFLAVLGDQPSGTNVEAPLSTIEEALQNVLNRNGNGDINITFTGDLAQLARVLRPVIEREGKRVGGNLIGGSIA